MTENNKDKSTNIDEKDTTQPKTDNAPVDTDGNNSSTNNQQVDKEPKSTQPKQEEPVHPESQLNKEPDNTEPNSDKVMSYKERQDALKKKLLEPKSNHTFTPNLEPEINPEDPIYKSSKRKTIVRLVATGVLAGVIGVNVHLATSIASSYNKTADWNTEGDSIAMANQSLDVLYDKNEQSRKIKNEFNKLASDMMSKDGNLTDKATSDNLKTLNQYIGKMNKKSNIESYQNKYDSIHEKMDIKAKYDKLFKEDGTLKANVTPITVNDLYLETKQGLSSMYNDNPNDKFVSEITKTQYKLAEDSLNINEMVREYNNAVDFEPSKPDYLKIKKGYFQDLPSVLSTLKDKLNYKWSALGYMMDTSDLMKTDLEKIIKQNQEFLAYTQDLKDKEQAYSDWDKEQQDFFYQKEQAKIEKARQEQLRKEQEEQARKQAEEDARRKAEEEQKRKEEAEKEEEQHTNSSTTTSSSDINTFPSTSDSSSSTQNNQNSGNTGNLTPTNPSRPRSSTSK